MLEALPEQLYACHALQEIVLDKNLLLCIPRALVTLAHLNFLSLSNNNLLYLPAMPFTSNVKLNIAANPNLNYLSFPLLNQNILSHDPSNILHLKNNR